MLLKQLDFLFFFTFQLLVYMYDHKYNPGRQIPRGFGEMGELGFGVARRYNVDSVAAMSAATMGESNEQGGVIEAGVIKVSLSFPQHEMHTSVYLTVTPTHLQVNSCCTRVRCVPLGSQEKTCISGVDVHEVSGINGAALLWQGRQIHYALQWQRPPQPQGSPRSLTATLKCHLLRLHKESGQCCHHRAHQGCSSTLSSGN